MTTLCGGILPETEAGWAEVNRRVAEQRSQDAEAAAWEAEQQRLRDEIDARCFAFLKAELEAENVATRVTAEQKKDFARFRDYVRETWQLPCLPAPAQAVAVFLMSESERGAAHIVKLRNSISAVHLALGMDDPTRDILIRALVRQAKAEATNSKQKGND
jgi:hypothetical protein